MFGHLYMRLVIDSFNLASVFQLSNHAEKIDHRAGAMVDIAFRRF